jgi:myo-inositol-1(or 4)-monophosphatase
MSSFANVSWGVGFPVEGHAQLVALLKAVGAFQLDHWQKINPDSVEDKGINQLVSFVDQESETQLMHGLRAILPNSAFIGEEHNSTAVLGEDPTWIIDPLDGTTNYLHGLPVFSISVALWSDGGLKAGYIYCPVWDYMYVAVAGAGAYKNDKRIGVSSVTEAKNSLLATGFPYYEFSKTPAYLQLLEELMRSTHGLRRMGSAAIDLAFTAEGRFDGFYELGLAPWDVAAGALIVQEACGTVSDFSGGMDYLFGKTIIASNATLYPYLLDRIEAYFGGK